MSDETRISILGSFQVELPDGGNPKFRTHRAAEIVARLSLQTGRQMLRRELAAEIWPEHEPSGQLANLRPALSYARTALESPEAIIVDDEMIGLGPNIRTDWSDLIRMETTARTASSTEDRLVKLFTLKEKMRRPLLEHWNQEWLDRFRLYYDLKRLEILRQLGEELGSRGDWEAALDQARTIIAVDPTAEEGVRLELRCLGELHRPDDARRAYAAYVRSLTKELGLGASPALQEFAQAVFDGRTATSGARSFTVRQQEFVRHALEVLTEHEPERLLPLFASSRLNWSMVLFGSEIRPLLERVLSVTNGWAPERAGAAKRLLQVYGQEQEFGAMATLSQELLESQDLKDQIAALNYLAWAASERVEFDCAKQLADRATEVARHVDDPYLLAVAETNTGILEIAYERYDEGIRRLIETRNGLAAGTGMNAVYSSSTANGWLMAAYFGQGDLGAAKAASEAWLAFAEIHAVLTHDASGKAIYASVIAHADKRSATSWLIQAMDTAARSQDRGSQEAVAIRALYTLERLGFAKASALGAAALRKILKRKGRFLLPFNQRLLAHIEPCSDDPGDSSVGEILGSLKETLLLGSNQVDSH